jgi:ParB-like chromosome segregation protein Spo0J
MTAQTNTSPSAGAEPIGPLELRPTGTLRPHPQQTLVPGLGREAYAALRADIAERGILVPLEVTVEGVVLDGHARLRAACELGVEHVEVRILAPDDEREHILLAALTRRQLSASQQAALLLELEQYRKMRAEARVRQRANLKQASEVATLPLGERRATSSPPLAGSAPARSKTRRAGRRRSKHPMTAAN